jgi:hypothetical protein
MLRLTSRAIRVCHPKGSEKTEVFWLGVCRQDGAARGKKGPAPRQGTRVLPPEAASSSDMDTWQGCTPNEQGVAGRC